MTLGYVIIAAVAAAAAFVFAVGLVLVGLAAKTFTRRMRQLMLLGMAVLMLFMYIFVALQKGHYTNFYGFQVFWIYYAFLVAFFVFYGAFLVMSLTRDIPSTLIGAAVLGVAGVFLLVGSRSSGSGIWVSFIFSGTCMLAYELWLLMTPGRYYTVYSSELEASRVEFIDNTTPGQKWVVWLSGLLPMLWLMAYGLDRTWAGSWSPSAVNGYAQFWAAFVYAALNLGMLGVGTLIYVFGINSEPEPMLVPGVAGATQLMSDTIGKPVTGGYAAVPPVQPAGLVGDELVL
jgi:hypothetical protein